MIRGRWRAGWLAVLSLLAGCAAGARLHGEALVVREKGYRVVPPPGWERIPSRADVALRNSALEAGLMAHGTCEGKAPGRALPVLARHLRFGLRDVQGLEEVPVTVAGQAGVRSRFTARLDGIPVAVGAVTLKRHGCVYDLVVVAPPGRLEAAAADFERFAQSFAVMETER